MGLDDIDITKDEFSTEELHMMGEILMLAEKIKKDSVLFANIEKALKKKEKEIRSISDIRRRAVETNAETEEIKGA